MCERVNVPVNVERDGDIDCCVWVIEMGIEVFGGELTGDWNDFKLKDICINWDENVGFLVFV